MRHKTKCFNHSSLGTHFNFLFQSEWRQILGRKDDGGDCENVQFYANKFSKGKKSAGISFVRSKTAINSGSTNDKPRMPGLRHHIPGDCIRLNGFYCPFFARNKASLGTKLTSYDICLYKEGDIGSTQDKCNMKVLYSLFSSFFSDISCFQD